MSNTPALGITLMAENVLAKEIIFNEAALKLEALIVGVAQSIQNSPPGSPPADGTCYIVGTSPTGAWSGHAKAVAMYYNGWQFITPTTRMRFYNVATSVYVRYGGGAWNNEAAGTASELSDLTDVALGTPLNNYVLGFSTVDNKWHAIPAPSVIVNINDLGDVDTDGPEAPADGQLLAWKTSTGKWSPVNAPAAGVDEFMDLDDVDPTGLADGMVPVWETSGTPRIVFKDPGDILTVTQLSDLPDVSLGGLTVGDALVWNGATWGPSHDLIEFQFKNMTDGPGTMEGAANKFLVVDALELSITYKSVSEVLAEGLDVKLQELADMPIVIGAVGQSIRVKASGDGFEYYTPSSGLTVQHAADTPLTTAAKRLRFVGATLTEPVTDEITITIDPVQLLEFQDGGVAIPDVSAINFTGPGVTLTDDAGVVEVNITGTDTLVDLTDVAVASPIDGDIVAWNASTSKFENKPIAAIVAEVDGVIQPNTYELGPFAPPIGAMFPDRYQATGVVITSVPTRGLVVVPSTLGATPYHMAITRTLAANTAPWTITCRVAPNSFNMAGHAAGIMMERAINGAMVFVGIGADQTDSLPYRLLFGHANNVHFETLVFNKKVHYNWLRLDFDGNTIYARASNDGLLWSLIGTLDAATVLGGVPTKVGLFQRMSGTPSGDTGALYTYYEDADYPASARTTMGYALATMSSLGDVDLLTAPPADGDTLVWDETSGTWVPGAGGGGASTLAALTDVDLTGLAAGDMLKYDGTKWLKFTPVADVHEIGQSLIAKPSDAEKLLRYEFASSVDWPVDLTTSRASSGVAATASTTFTLKKNGVSVGTIVFSAAGTTGAFTVTATSWVAGDILLIEAPATADATLAEISFTLKGARV